MTLDLATDEITALLRAGAAAPSAYNSQPWRLRWVGGAVELHGEPARALALADPDDRELRLACGAATMNVRVAVRAGGRRVHCHLLPDPDDPWLFARIRPGSARAPLTWERELADAVPRRHTERRPFLAHPVSRRHRDDLRRGAERERCWLVFVDDATERRQVREATAAAHRAQRHDPAFVAEWDRWIGHVDRYDDGIPPELAARAPRPDGVWRVRDFGGSGSPGRPGNTTADDPTIAVVGTFGDGPLAQLQAGEALEAVLLTATARGLAASIIAAPLEVASGRAEVRRILGGGLWPQAVLRLGHGRPVPATPRRPQNCGDGPALRVPRRS